VTKFEIASRHVCGDQGKSFNEKTEVEKFRGTVPLSKKSLDATSEKKSFGVIDTM
jgi:hypothetical protein